MSRAPLVWVLLALALGCEAKVPPAPPVAAPPPVPPAPAPPPALTAQALFDESQAAIAKNELEAALTALEKCVATDPAHALCHRSLGLLFDHRGEAAAACTHYRRYLELEPKAADGAELEKRLGSCP